MKTINVKELPAGRLRVTVEISNDEHLMTVRGNNFYRLGGQVQDIVQAHVIEEMRQVRWCSISQDWIEA